MMNVALPATMRTEDGELITDINPDMLKCVGCQKSIMSTALCVYIKKRLWCGEVCASLHALNRLRHGK